MVLRISKNNALNEAAAGLERGIARGAQLGIAARRTKIDEEDSRVRREQILRQAQHFDQQLAREDQQRQASGEAFGEMATTPQSPPMPQMGGPLGGMLKKGGQQIAIKAQIERVGRIAKRWAQAGGDPRDIAAFVNEVRAKHAKLIDDHEREDLENLIGNDMAGSGLFTAQPDGVLAESKETSKAAESMITALGQGAPVEEVRADRVKLKRQQAKDRTAKKHLTDTLAGFDGDIATMQATRSGGPGNEGRLAAGILQGRVMQGIRDEYEQFADDFLRDPDDPKAQEFLRGIEARWAQAKNGIAYVSKEFGPVTFEAAGQMREAEQRIQAAEESAKRAQADADAARAKSEPIKADAAMKNATRPRGPASGTVTKPLSMKEALDTARATLEKSGEPLSIEAVYHEARRLISAEREARKFDAEEAGASGEAEAQEVTPEQAAALGWSDEDWIEYEKTGAVPK